MAEAQARQVRQFVDQLDREDRYIVLLYYADGLSPVEIARVLDLPSTRVRKRLGDLRARLSSVMKQTQAHSRTKRIGRNRPSGPTATAYA